MKPPGPSADRLIIDNRPLQRLNPDGHWQTAGDRVLLYLRCLNFPTPQALEIACRTLKRAEQNIAMGSSDSPLAEAMLVLHEILSEQEPGMSGAAHASADPSASPIPAAPSIHRLSMISDKTTLHRRSSLLANLGRPFKLRSSEG